MKFLFIDEVAYSQKDRKFLGVGAILIDSTKYVAFKENFYKAFNKMEWDLTTEFKGRYLFSQKGDDKVPAQKRIEFIHEIVKSSKARKNANYKFYFAYNFNGSSVENYFSLLVSILRNISPPYRSNKKFKNLIALYIDNRNDLNEFDLYSVCDMELKRRGYILFERPLLISSSNLTPGVVTVDILSYLKAWDILNPKEASLFYNQLPDVNKKKLKIIRNIISSLKSLREIQE